MAKIITRKEKKGKLNKLGQKMCSPKEPRMERANYPTCGRKLFPTAPLMLLTCKLWDLIIIEDLKQASLANVIFLSMAKTKASWKAILTCSLKNGMQKGKDKWLPNRLSWKIWAYSLMKKFMSCPNALCTSMAIGVKWCPSWSLLYLWNLILALSFATTLDGRLMTFVTTISHVRLLITTLATKT